MLGILADVLRRPTFPPEQVERLRGELLTGLAQRDQHTGSVAGMAFDELAYPGHPYAIAADGYPHTIQAITREDLAAFHRRHYGPRKMMIAVVGGIPAEQALALAAQHFGDWTNPEQPPEPELPALAPLEGVRRKHAPLAGKSQSDLVLGVPGPLRSDPGYLAAMLGNNILGRFGMYGRIGDAVRDAAGLAYYSYSSLNGGLGPGPWSVIAG
ncbi:MAG: insulinase family protein, partial [Chloroflexi bacterium]|nr:insulinase family protein [Chloroflexota bacterium]